MTNLFKYEKKILYLEIFNFKTFMAEILQIFELLKWKIDDFINSFRVYLTFMKLIFSPMFIRCVFNNTYKYVDCSLTSILIREFLILRMLKS